MKREFRVIYIRRRGRGTEGKALNCDKNRNNSTLCQDFGVVTFFVGILSPYA